MADDSRSQGSSNGWDSGGLVNLLNVVTLHDIKIDDMLALWRI